MSNVKGAADHIADRAKRELDMSEANLENAQRQLEEAMERHARAKIHFVEADLQRNCSWNRMYKRLTEYKVEYGDTLVLTTKDSSADIKKLAKWVQNQRVHYKYHMNGDKKHIKEHRIQALNGIGFVWNVLEYSWDINFSRLESYYEEHGHFNVPKKYCAKLNNFVTNLRKAMRRKREGLLQKELTEERINRLNSINFNWEMKHPSRQRTVGENVQFDYLYDLLVDFKNNYGHIQVSKMLPIWREAASEAGGPARKEYKRLPFFIASVRNEQELFLQGKPCALDEEKVRKLTELGLKWKKPASEPRMIGAKRKKIEQVNNDNGLDASVDVMDDAEPIADEGIEDEEPIADEGIEAACVEIPKGHGIENHEGRENHSASI